MGLREDKTLSKDRTCTHLLPLLLKPGSSQSTSLGVPDPHYSLHILGITFDLPKVSQGSTRGFSEPPETQSGAPVWLQHKEIQQNIPRLDFLPSQGPHTEF